MSGDYKAFIADKAQFRHEAGFDPGEMPDFLFDFQKYLTEWALRKGRCLISADCGMGKTAMQLAFAQKVIERENKPVLIATPIAVGMQTVAEAAKFGIEAVRTRDGVFDGSAKVWVTNYEQLHKYDPDCFAAVICDESSCIKNHKSERKKIVGEFLRTIRFRLACTATAAPNDVWELGTTSDVLGLLGFRDMVTTFFKQETSKDHLGWGRTKYRFRGHAEEPFWAWVCSWARSLRKPSDLGFRDDGFNLPELIEKENVIECTKTVKGRLFSLPGASMQDEREERVNSIEDRCAFAADIVRRHKGASVMWCERDDEADTLVRMLDDCEQVSGKMADDKKEETLQAFSSGQLKRLVLKPKLGAWGLNWQHCHNVVSMPSHSYEQYYQAVRRCWRFGQKNQVTVNLVVSEGEFGILENLKRKSAQADNMFSSIVSHMKDAMHLQTQDFFAEKEQVPKWL